MAIDVNSIQEFTLAEHLVMVEHAIAMVQKRQSYAINGRTYTSVDLNQLRSWRREILAEIAVEEVEDDLSGGIALARFNRHQ